MPDSGNLPSQRVSNTPNDKIPPKDKIPSEKNAKKIDIKGVCIVLGITVPIYNSPRLVMTAPLIINFSTQLCPPPGTLVRNVFKAFSGLRRTWR